MPPIVPIAIVPFVLSIVASLVFVRRWRKSLMVEWILALTVGGFTGVVGSFFEPLRTLDQDAVCGAGGTLMHTESNSDDEGTTHDFHCSNGHDSVLIALHVAGCVLMMVGIFALVVLTLSALRRTMREAR